MDGPSKEIFSKKVVVVFLVGVFIGALWHRLYIFPWPQLKAIKAYVKAQIVPSDVSVASDIPPQQNVIIITEYGKNFPVFSDREYYDSIGDDRLSGLILVQIPRHHMEDIVIKAHTSLTVYRFLSEDNDNALFDDWQSSPIPIHVKGRSSSHTRVVQKDFGPGKIVLSAGGPISTAPILVKVKNFPALSYGFEILEGLDQ